MNEWFKKLSKQAKDLWAKGTVVQKIILFALIAAVIVAVVLAAAVPSRSTSEPVFNGPVADSAQRQRILDRLSQENIKAHSDADGNILIDDSDRVTPARSILISEGLVPSNIDPWEGYYNRSWSTTDSEQNRKAKNAIQTTLKNHLESIGDIYDASVMIVLPEKELFTDDQDPVTASVALKVNPSSDLYSDRKRIRGIQRLIISAIQGLKDENVIITDGDGNQINDFEGMEEYDRLSQAERWQKDTLKLSAKFAADLRKAFYGIYGQDRIRDSIIVNITRDGSKKSSHITEHFPVTIKADNPDTPYDDSEFRDSIVVSSQTVTREWQGTGFNPEGPAGVEGQTPPVYTDMSNVIGRETQTGVTQNNAVNKKETDEETMPGIDRVTVSMNIDGTWRIKRDPETHEYIIDPETGGLSREYIPVPDDELVKATDLIKDAIGYDKTKNYSVTVRSIQNDRTAEHEAEDAAYFKAKQMKRAILLALIVVALVLVGFIIFRVISREMERRRREREEELLRKQQAAREQALWDAKEDGMEVTMSVEESRRAELQENAIAMAKAHPEDVAMLIRTWLAEE